MYRMYSEEVYTCTWHNNIVQYYVSAFFIVSVSSSMARASMVCPLLLTSVTGTRGSAVGGRAVEAPGGRGLLDRGGRPQFYRGFYSCCGPALTTTIHYYNTTTTTRGTNWEDRGLPAGAGSACGRAPGALRGSGVAGDEAGGTSIKLYYVEWPPCNGCRACGRIQSFSNSLLSVICVRTSHNLVVL